MWRAVDEICRRGVAEGAFPGAVVLVGDGREILLHRAYGHRALAPERLPMTPDTVFDVSSLTKPMATTTAMMLLVRDGRLRLDDPVCTVIPEFGAGGGTRVAVTFRHLLNHTSGLPAWKPYYESVIPAEPAEGRKPTPLPLGESGRRPGEGSPAILPDPSVGDPHPDPLPEGEGGDCFRATVENPGLSRTREGGRTGERGRFRARVENPDPSYYEPVIPAEPAESAEPAEGRNPTPLPLGEGGRRPGEGSPAILPDPSVGDPHPDPLPEGEGGRTGERGRFRARVENPDPSYYESVIPAEPAESAELAEGRNPTPLPLGEGGRRPGEGPPAILPDPSVGDPHPDPLPEGEGARFRAKVEDSYLSLAGEGARSHAVAEVAVRKRGFFAQVHAERLLARPGEKHLYSDLGFILLGEVVERLSGMRLDRFCEDRVFAPMGLDSTFFVDLSGSAPERRPGAGRAIAATEDCPWRGRILCGEVHDDNAHAMGGVAGHAGLFSSASDIHRFVRFLGRCLDGAEPDFLPAAVVRQFLEAERPLPGQSHVLGWDTPSPAGSSSSALAPVLPAPGAPSPAGSSSSALAPVLPAPDAPSPAGSYPGALAPVLPAPDTPSRAGSSSGRHFSARTVGHLGFTGTSIWWDLERDLHVVFLTNRVHPSRDNAGIREFRPMVHDAVMEGLSS